MQMTCRLTTVLLGIVAMVYAAMTHAAELPPGPHFTFNVPLHLANLRTEISHYMVQCSVGAPRDLTWGTGETFAAISSGAVVDTVVAVNVTVGSGRVLYHPADATNYACNLLLSNGGTVYYLDLSGRASFPLAPGQPYQTFRLGTIPR
jgi:hypothetical protein